MGSEDGVCLFFNGLNLGFKKDFSGESNSFEKYFKWDFFEVFCLFAYLRSINVEILCVLVRSSF